MAAPKGMWGKINNPEPQKTSDIWAIVQPKDGHIGDIDHGGHMEERVCLCECLKTWGLGCVNNNFFVF